MVPASLILLLPLVLAYQISFPLCPEIPSAICLVGDGAEDGRHDAEVYEGETGSSRRPAEVLVSVRGHDPQLLNGRVRDHVVVF